LRATHAPSNIGSRSSQRGNLNIHRLSFGECQLHFNGNLSISRSRRHYDARFIPISHLCSTVCVIATAASLIQSFGEPSLDFFLVFELVLWQHS
jgi:hypothetical protein